MFIILFLFYSAFRFRIYCILSFTKFLLEIPKRKQVYGYFLSYPLYSLPYFIYFLLDKKNGRHSHSTTSHIYYLLLLYRCFWIDLLFRKESLFYKLARAKIIKLIFFLEIFSNLFQHVDKHF